MDLWASSPQTAAHDIYKPLEAHTVPCSFVLRVGHLILPYVLIYVTGYKLFVKFVEWKSEIQTP